LRLILENDSIKFEPDFSDYEDVLLNVYAVMIQAVSDIPRAETKLFPKRVRNHDTDGFCFIIILLLHLVPRYFNE